MKQQDESWAKMHWMSALVAAGAATGFVGELSSLKIPRDTVGTYIKDQQIEVLEPGTYLFGKLRFPEIEPVSTSRESTALVRMILRDVEGNSMRELDLAIDYRLPENLTPLQAYQSYNSRLYDWKIGNLCLQLLDAPNMELPQAEFSKKTFQQHEEYLKGELSKSVDVEILAARVFYRSDSITYIMPPDLPQFED